MSREDLFGLLPHRGHMLLLDGARREGEEAVAWYTVRGDEFFLNGHFPGNPVVPGVILCEMIAQSACVLLEGMMQGKLPLYTGMDRVRFRSPARPGDTLTMRCRITRQKHPFYFCTGRVLAGERLCAEAQFSFAIAEAEACSQKS